MHRRGNGYIRSCNSQSRKKTFTYSLVKSVYTVLNYHLHQTARRESAKMCINDMHMTRSHLNRQAPLLSHMAKCHAPSSKEPRSLHAPTPTMDGANEANRTLRQWSRISAPRATSARVTPSNTASGTSSFSATIL